MSHTKSKIDPPLASILDFVGWGCGLKRANRARESKIVVASWRRGVVASWRGGVVAWWRGGVVAWWRGGVVAWWRGVLGRWGVTGVDGVGSAD
ncbi:hypothetical protein GCM10012284_59150 [Mangrovihabitans endophyticus]|uniref:Uncharacterized protein n=1 Tax=Mangrovihabitans endophyticus TaxID=1751298 RepID=A0A8J3FS36_9ACTN|nr:hypothetical protein GCM10012284_59150 [Mangrovihabitans endophyticus]